MLLGLNIMEGMPLLLNFIAKKIAKAISNIPKLSIKGIWET